MKTISAPQIKRHCQQCNQVTGTVFKFMPAGIGNACADCGTFRKGKPYISRNEINALMPEAAQGGTDEVEAL